MASIETRQQPMSASLAARSEAGARGERASGSHIAAGIFAVASRAKREYRLRFQRFRKLTNASQVDLPDLQALTRCPPETVMADLTRFLGWIDRREGEDGANDTTRLARVMADEHLRRLMLARPPRQSSLAGNQGFVPKAQSESKVEVH